MTLWQRIESLDELDAYLRDLFGPDINPLAPTAIR